MTEMSGGMIVLGVGQPAETRWIVSDRRALADSLGLAGCRLVEDGQRLPIDRNVALRDRGGCKTTLLIGLASGLAQSGAQRDIREQAGELAVEAVRIARRA